MQLVCMLLGMSSFGPLPYGAISKVANKFRISRATASRLWSSAKLSRLEGMPNQEEIVSKNNLRGVHSGRWDDDAVKEATIAIPRKKRKTVRALAQRLGMPRSTVHYLRKKKKVFVRHSNALKPLLTEEHMLARVDYALEQRDPDNLGRYKDMYDCVHVDEKWFFMTKDNEVYILADGEEPPKRSTSHKGYIKKVMFLAVVARPRKINGKMWDGKIAIIPVGHYEPAQRASRNRPAGTPVWKNETIDRDKYRELMIDHVLPAVLAHFPTAYLERHGVIIQQDGAKSHIKDDDPQWLEAVRETGCKIKLQTQPAQSPDLNINDLAFFRSIQSLYYEAAPDDETELIEAVKKAFDDYSAAQINRMWLTLQSCCNQILAHNGDNNYTLVHMNKEKLEKEGRLPKVLDVDDAARKFDPTHP